MQARSPVDRDTLNTLHWPKRHLTNGRHYAKAIRLVGVAGDGGPPQTLAVRGRVGEPPNGDPRRRVRHHRHAARKTSRDTRRWSEHLPRSSLREDGITSNTNQRRGVLAPITAGESARRGHRCQVRQCLSAKSVFRRSPRAADSRAQHGRDVTTFARTGRPAAVGQPAWPAYDLTRRAMMRIDTQCEVIDDRHREEREMWKALGYIV